MLQYQPDACRRYLYLRRAAMFVQAIFIPSWPCMTYAAVVQIRLLDGWPGIAR